MEQVSQLRQLLVGMFVCCPPLSQSDWPTARPSDESSDRMTGERTANGTTDVATGEFAAAVAASQAVSGAAAAAAAVSIAKNNTRTHIHMIALVRSASCERCFRRKKNNEHSSAPASPAAILPT